MELEEQEITTAKNVEEQSAETAANSITKRIKGFIVKIYPYCMLSFFSFLLGTIIEAETGYGVPVGDSSHVRSVFPFLCLCLLGIDYT